MKKYIEMIKKIWANKRLRAIAILILYALFFIFVFTFINAFDKTTNSLKTPLQLLKEDKYYSLLVEGEDTFSFSSIDNTYNYLGVEYQKDELEILKKYNIDNINPVNIYNLFSKATKESTNYVLETDTYVVKISDFEKIINNKEILNDEYIKIIVLKEFEEVTIDLIDYYGYKVTLER